MFTRIRIARGESYSAEIINESPRRAYLRWMRNNLKTLFYEETKYVILFSQKKLSIPSLPSASVFLYFVRYDKPVLSSANSSYRSQILFSVVRNARGSNDCAAREISARR